MQIGKLTLCVALAITFQCKAEWYTHNPDAWLLAIQNTERARERASKEIIEDKLILPERSKQMPQVMPVKGVISSNFGMRVHPLYDELKHHNGVDIAAQRGAPISAIWPGTVVRSSFSPSFGNVVEIDHGKGKLTRYAHADKLNVSVGDKVKTGDVLGSVGSTGLATGPHLHFELIENGRRLNPMSAHQILAATTKPKVKAVNQAIADTSFKNKVNAREDYTVAKAEQKPVRTIESVELSKVTGEMYSEINIQAANPNKQSLSDSEILESIKLADNVAIWDLAKQIRGKSSIYQALYAIYKLNPGVFINDNINLRKAGAHIVLPSSSYISSMSRKEGMAKMLADNTRLKSRSELKLA